MTATTRLPDAVDVAGIGGGQAGLATGYYLRRAGLVPGADFLVLDAGDRPAGDPAGPLVVRTGEGALSARVVVSATGTWTRPFWPHVAEAAAFTGRQLHTVDYRRAEDFTGQRVEALRVGDDHPGSAAWGTSWRSRASATPATVGRSALPMFTRLTAAGLAWRDGTQRPVDAVIWCTGFRPALRHLRPLRLSMEAGHLRLGGPTGTQSTDEPRLHLVGYGDWSGPASATLIGAGRTARDTVRVLVDQVRAQR